MVSFFREHSPERRSISDRNSPEGRVVTGGRDMPLKDEFALTCPWCKGKNPVSGWGPIRSSKICDECAVRVMAKGGIRWQVKSNGPTKPGIP